jgi:hypothetical protein
MCKTIVLVAILVVLISLNLYSNQLPNLINYQGKITILPGVVIDTSVMMQFSIYTDSIAGIAVWTEVHSLVQINKGIFNVLLGSVNSIPENLTNNSVLWLGMTIGGDSELPRKRFGSVPFAFRAGNARDIYQQSIDIMPNSSLKFYIYPRYPNSKVTLYLHGDGFVGALTAHSHTGTNSHAHEFLGQTSLQNIDHTHNFSATTGNQSNDHTHSGTTSAYDLSHSHAGTIGYSDPSHAHSGTADAVGNHGHTLAVDGEPGTGNYLVHRGTDGPDQLSSSNTADRFCLGSVLQSGGHGHNLTINSASINHTHGLSITNSLGTHSHSFTTSGTSLNHTHGLSGTTGGTSTGHFHDFSGSTESFGSGLELTGVVPGTFPSSVRLYIDGTAVSGPYSGQFSSGIVDISSYIADTQEHTIEIREEGGTGGRIIYTLFVE